MDEMCEKIRRSNAPLELVISRLKTMQIHPFMGLCICLTADVLALLAPALGGERVVDVCVKEGRIDQAVTERKAGKRDNLSAIAVDMASS